MIDLEDKVLTVNDIIQNKKDYIKKPVFASDYKDFSNYSVVFLEDIAKDLKSFRCMRLNGDLKCFRFIVPIVYPTKKSIVTIEDLNKIDFKIGSTIIYKKENEDRIYHGLITNIATNLTNDKILFICFGGDVYFYEQLKDFLYFKDGVWNKFI